MNYYLGQNLFEEDREYRVCATLWDALKVPSPRHSTFRTAHVSMDAVRSRTAEHSTDNNMREVQAAMRMIVESPIKYHTREIRKQFIWMMSMDCTETKQMGLFVKLEWWGIL